MYPSHLLYQDSEETDFPGDIQAGYMEQFGDPRIINFPLRVPSYIGHTDFNENLALHVDEGELNQLGQHLSDAIKADDDARQKYLRTIRDAVEYLGIGNDRYKNGNYAKGSDIYAPTLLKIATFNASKLHSNLFPSQNFVESKTWGQINEDVEDQAYRMKEFANYMLEDVMEDYFEDKEQALFWMAISGNVFTKPYLDNAKDIPVCPYIRTEDIIINSGASGISNAERVTYRYTLSKRLIEQKFNSRVWRRVYVEDYDGQEDIVRQKIESKVGVETQVEDTNKIGCFDECMCYWDLNGFNHTDKYENYTGRLLPYIVTKDKSNNNIVDIRRNWNKNDPRLRPIRRIIQWKYFSGWGPYGFGLAHLMLGLARCETEILQQLILAAKLSNAPSLLQNTIHKNERGQINVAPGVINQVATFDNNIQNAFMPLPFKEPSGVLMQLMDKVTDAMNDQSAATDFSPEQLPSNTGELLTAAIISTSHILENSTMKGLYRSFKGELKLLYNIFAEWLPESPYPFDVPGGSHVIMREDFTPNIRISPTIDPNCASTLHQITMAESLLNLAQQNPDLYDIRSIHKRILSALKIENPDQVLMPDPDEDEIPELDFISDNARALRGEPIKAYPTQDHDAHIIGKQDMIDKLSNDESQDYSKVIAALNANITEHKVYKYLANMQALIGKQLPDDVASIPEQMQNSISMQAAQALLVEKEKEDKKNPPPIDPNEVMMEELSVKRYEAEVKSQQIQVNLQIEEAKIQKQNEKDIIDQQIRIKELEVKDKQLQIEQYKLQIQEREMELKAQIEMAKVQQADKKADLDIQAKTYDTTLKHESEKEIEEAKLEESVRKTDMESQNKAFDSALNYEQEQSQVTNENKLGEK